MDQIIEFFLKLLNTDDWPARWNCGNWSEFHGWLYIFSDFSIWLAYFIIPVILIWVIQKRPDMSFPPIFFYFGAFIILCGMTHLIDAVLFWWPAYRLSGFIRILTAIVSFLTVFQLIHILPTISKLNILENKSNDIKSKNNTSDIEQIKELAEKRKLEIKELKSKISKLENN